MQRLCQCRKSLCDGLSVSRLCGVLQRARRFAPKWDRVKVYLREMKWTCFAGRTRRKGTVLGKPAKREPEPYICVVSEKCRTTFAVISKKKCYQLPTLLSKGDRNATFVCPFCIVSTIKYHLKNKTCRDVFWTCDSDFKIVSIHRGLNCSGHLMLTIDLTGKTAVVTGASQGLGEATARMLHAAGSCVVVNYFDDSLGENRQRAERLVRELGDRALAVAADVRDVVAVDAMRDTVQQKFGRLDILINNAGIIRDHTMKKMGGDDWQTVLDTNLTGVFQVCQSLVTVMEQGGRIINLASISAVIGFFGQSNYAAAKAGVIGLTRVLSKELAGREITVNAVAPGVVLTPMGQSIPDPAREKMLEQIPLGRFGEPRDIAHAITFLSSDFASYITGQTIHVNGGWWG